VILPFRVYSLPELLQLRHLLGLTCHSLEQTLVGFEMKVVLDLSETCLTLVLLNATRLDLKVLGDCTAILLERCPRYFHWNRFLLMEGSLRFAFEGFWSQLKAALMAFEGRHPQKVRLSVVPCVLLKLYLRLILRRFSETGSEAPPLPGLAVNAEFGLGSSDPLIFFVVVVRQVSQVLLLPFLRELFAGLSRARIR